ncbi:MAG: glycosyltransferase family 4 protein [Anaerolineales bacterium]
MYVLDCRTANAHYPGIGRYTFDLARALARITPLTVILNPLQATPEFDFWDVSAKRVSVPHTPRSLAQQWVVPARLRPLRAALYHSPLYLRPYWLDIPSVVTAYDLIPLLAPQGYSAAQRLLYHAAHWLTFRTAARILTLTEASREEFGRRFHLPPTQIAVVAPGLPANFKPQSAEDVIAVRERYALPNDYLLYVGSNKPHKNLPALIEAYTRLPASAPPLVIAGPEDARYPQHRWAANELGDRVRLLGRVPDEALPALYGGALVYVQPSQREGFGFPVLEAMGCGAAVVCADIPVLREVAQNAALYFDPAQSSSIAQTLTEVLENISLRTALRERGLLRARFFTWERAAIETVRVYERVAVSSKQ